MGSDWLSPAPRGTPPQKELNASQSGSRVGVHHSLLHEREVHGTSSPRLGAMLLTGSSLGRLGPWGDDRAVQPCLDPIGVTGCSEWQNWPQTPVRHPVCLHPLWPLHAPGQIPAADSLFSGSPGGPQGLRDTDGHLSGEQRNMKFIIVLVAAEGQ